MENEFDVIPQLEEDYPLRQQKAETSQQTRRFDYISKINSGYFLSYIQSEHPQTIAMILAYIEPKLAAVILQDLPAEMQSDVARRIATIDRINPKILHKVEKTLENELSELAGEDCSLGGVDSIVDILNMTSRYSEKSIIEAIEDDVPELAEEIKRRMFMFKDIVMLNDKAVQKIMREVDAMELAKALKSTDAKVRNKFFKNMSKRAAAMLKEEMDFLGNLTLVESEECQQKIVSITRYLEDAGEIFVARADDVLISEDKPTSPEESVISTEENND